MDEYPDDTVTQPAPGPAPGGRPPVAFGAMVIDPIAFEEEEPEHSDGTIRYGSLLSLGSSMRKKRPLIVVDEVEAENEARRVQFVAAQQLVDPDEADGIEFRECLAQFAEPDASEEDVVAAESPDVDSVANEQLELVGDRELAEVVGQPIDVSQPPETALDIAETPDDDRPIVTEAPHLEPAPVSHGHSLRSRIPARPPRRTASESVLAFLGWLGEWLTRPR